MDLNSLKDQVSSLTLYDLKAGVRKVQNGECSVLLLANLRSCVAAVMNYTEMEAKVREATNNEPWGTFSVLPLSPLLHWPIRLSQPSGASSTLMQEIANGTFN